MLLPIIASADAVEIDGIFYNLISKGNVAEVTKNPEKYKGDISIPKTVSYGGIIYEVVSIESTAFLNCNELNSVDISNNITSIQAGAFSNSGIKSIIISNNVKSLGNEAFRGCLQLTNVVIGDGISDIEFATFSGCSRLVEITIGRNVKTIDNYAFSNCVNLNTVNIFDLKAFCEIEYKKTSSGSEVHPLFSYANKLLVNGEELHDLIVPNDVTTIGSYSFCGYKGLKSVIISNNVTRIGKNSFDGCTNLSSFTMGNNVKRIEEFALRNCNLTTSIKIPSTLTYIGSSAFLGNQFKEVEIDNLESYCKVELQKYDNSSVSGGTWPFNNSDLIIDGKMVTDLVIPTNISSLSSHFSHCNSITSVVTNAIGERSFGGCANLKKVIIGENVKNVSKYAFIGCSSLSEVHIGKSVSNFEDYSFANCTELSDIYFYGEIVPKASSLAFSNSYTQYATLHVPSSLVSNYKMASPWKQFKNIVPFDGEYPSTSKCQKPIINYTNGKLTFSSDTEGVEFVSEISDTDIKKHYDAEVQLSATYIVTVYTTKSGYENSDVATATLCWIDQQPQTEGITDGVAQVPAKAVLIKSNGGMLTVEGVDDGETIDVYTINGVKKGSIVSQNGVASIDTNIQSGNVAIVKIKNKSVKVAIK